MKKILAFAGSNSHESINKKLVTHVLTYFQEFETELLDLNDYEMPLYQMDKELKMGIPKLATDFASKIDAADLLIFSLAEHNSSYTVAFKNIFDWISRIKDRKHFGDKPVFLLSTAPGAGGGMHVSNAFLARATFSGANVLTNYLLPEFSKHFDEANGLTNTEKKQELLDKIKLVKETF